jgi:hypothetical protein
MYFIMEWHAPVGQTPMRLEILDNYTESWQMGARFEESELPPTPLRLGVDPESEGTFLLDLMQAPVVLMSKRLVASLQRAGVDNMDLYPVTITDPRTGGTYDTHVAVNVVGVISAADLKASVVDTRLPGDMITTAFDKLVLKEDAARRQLLFRLAENVGALVVHEKVKERVEADNFETILFMEPEGWFGG